MAYVRRYKDLGTDLDGLYRDVVMELSATKELNIVNELEGEANNRPFRSVTAVRQTIPRMFVGALREVTVTITGEPDDYLVEIHTGAWFSNLAVPGAGAFIIGGPIAGVAAAGATGIYAVKYERDLSKKIKEFVQKNSQKDVTLEKVERLP